MKIDDAVKSTRSNQARKGGSSVVRPKVGRGIGRKRLKLSQTRPSHGRTDEDSGLGGETSTTDSVCEETPKSNEINLTSYFLAVDGDSENLVLPNFGSKTKSHSISRCSNVESKPKRLRLDMTEEANELPEQKSDATPTALQIFSFKNVPDLKPIIQSTNLINPARIFSTNGLHSFLQPLKISKPQQVVQPVVQTAVRKVNKVEKPVRGESGFSSKSSDGKISLELLSQPESQHRARYQTEGSRGAVKDRSGQGHPIIKLNGYSKSTVLKVFVASDGDSISPHMFYQACKVTGKNSTPCSEVKEDGTIILHIDMTPENEMTVSCDCVGILKERNVDVEERMKSMISRGRKKSHKCRLVFRTAVILNSGKIEELQVVSQLISCSQPPGLPELCRKSLSKSSVEGGEELFIIGKNFSKDTEVVFQKTLKDQKIWEQKMVPEKEYLNGAHLICQVPPYHDISIMECVDVQIFVVSNGKKSDPQTFTYVPLEPKEESCGSVQIQPLPKEISPSAVKLNRLYAESEALKLPKSTPTFSNIRAEQVENLKGQLIKENTVSRPLFFNDTASNSISPSVATKTRTKVDSTNSNTFSTSALSPPIDNTSIFVPIMTSTGAPASSILPYRKNLTLTHYPAIAINTQKHKTVENELKTTTDGKKIKDQKIPESTDQSVIENLCHMLKFVYALPAKLQSSLLELLSNELLTQIRGKGLSIDTPRLNVDSSTSPPARVGSKVTVSERSVFANDKKNKCNINPCDNFSSGLANQIPNRPSSNQSFILPMAIIPTEKLHKRVNLTPFDASYTTTTAKQHAITYPLENKPFSHSNLIRYQYDTRQFSDLSSEQRAQNSNIASLESSSTNQMDFLNMNRMCNSNMTSESQPLELTNDVHKTQNSLTNAEAKSQFLVSNFSAPEIGMSEDIKAVNSIGSLFANSPNFDFRPQHTTASLSPFILTPTMNAVSSRGLLTPSDAAQSEQLFTQRNMPTERAVATTYLHDSILHSQLSTGMEEHSNMLLHERENISIENNCVSNSTLSNSVQGNNTVADSTLAAYPHGLETTMRDYLGSIPTTYDLSSVMHSENCDPLLSQASNSPLLRIDQSNAKSESVSSDVTTTLPQLSESELLSYINPNCFDNV